jgi:metal-responsive CopG/Arc/MetJ family transcriptional regulator
MTINQKHIKIAITSPYHEGIDLLIADGLYETQTEVIKDALRRLLRHYEIPILIDQDASITVCYQNIPISQLNNQTRHKPEH